MEATGGMDENEEDEQVVSISEFIEGMERQQLEADLVLGGDEGNECTYVKGYMKRQAVFSCLSCTPAGNAGFCTACSLVCHDGHEVVELWTRRGFRCDCGNDKFGALECKLYKAKEGVNQGNTYNQNYGGLYCLCHRPFPDPEGTEQGEMLQCCICEDWFHESHLGLSSSQLVPRDDDGEPAFDELICSSCVSRCSFLSRYPDLLVSPDEIQLPTSSQPSPSAGSNEIGKALVSEPSSDVKPSPSKENVEALVSEPSVDVELTRHASEASELSGNLTEPATEGTAVEVKLQALGKANVVMAIGESSNGGPISPVHCKLKQPFHIRSFPLQANGGLANGGEGAGLKSGVAVFLAKSWRAELCRCKACLAMYEAKALGFLLDKEDTIQEYEDTAKIKHEESKVKEEGTAWDFMKKLGHVQKMELFHGFNDMATELESFLTPFGQAGKTVTSADIYEFFDNLQRKRRKLN